MKHRPIYFFFCILIALSLVSSTAYADMGPKPSVNLQFKGMGKETYYITLLSKNETTGPYSYSTDKIDEGSSLLNDHKEDGLKAWKAFRDYKDADGFYFINYFQRSNDEDTFTWGYYPPSTFKVLLYYPDSGTFSSSGIYERYAFDSYYKVKLSEDKTSLTLSKNYNYFWEIISLLARIAATVLVEILIALCFGLWKKKIIKFIIIVNMATQIILNVLLNIANYSRGGLMFIFCYIALEILVIIVEWLIYMFYFKKISKGMEKPIKKWIAPAYSIVANTVSFALGMYLAYIIPGIF